MTFETKSTSMETIIRGASVENEVNNSRLEFVVRKHSSSFGRKRILISKGDEDIEDSSSAERLKRSRSEEFSYSDTSPQGALQSPLETLPSDIVVKIVCRVDEDDLNRLYCVSKGIGAAAKIAKESHFKYQTPKKFRVFRTEFDEFNEEFTEFEAPNAPKRQLSSIRKRDLSDVCIALFSTPVKRGSLFTDSGED